MISFDGGKQVALESLQNRARQSLGSSGDPIYQMVATTVAQRHAPGGVLVDLGCGQGKLWSFVSDRFDRYVGVDAVRYPDLPPHTEFIALDLNTTKVPFFAARFC